MGILAQSLQKARSLKIPAALALALCCAHPAQANIGEITGFGARSASLGGAAGAWGADAFAAYSNPALLALTGGARFQFSYHVVYVTPKITAIGSVLTQNSVFQDGNQTSNVDTTYRDTFGQTFGASYQLFPDWWNLSLGAVIYLPLAQTAYLATGSAYIPEYILYRSRTHRPQIDLGLGAHPWGPLYLGLGVHVGFGINSRANVFLQSSSPQASSMDFTTSLTPKAVPYLSVLFAQNGHASSWDLGLVARLPLAYDNNMYLRTQLRPALLGALDVNFDAHSTLLYDPGSLELSGSLQILEWLRAVAQIDLAFWGFYSPAVLTIESPKDEAGTINMRPSNNPTYTTQHILIPRLGAELSFDPIRVRLGYAYRPSILAQIPSGSANPVDPPSHRFNLGFGYQFRRFFGLERPWSLDAHLTWQHLVTGSVTKAGTSDIGYPGYSTGGNLFGGGVSLSFTL